MDFCIKRDRQYTVYVNEQESEAVKIAAGNLRTDLGKVFGREGAVSGNSKDAHIVAGTLSMLPKELLEDIGALPENGADGCRLFDENAAPRKEAYLIRVKEGRLFLVGTDRRGCIYAVYEFCQMLGVSPWYFWADVPVYEKEQYVLQDGFVKSDYPSVEYRGIFINDEEELETWVKNYMKESTIGVKTYEKIFELLLRLKGNYIWPAMHVNSFNLLQENGALADRMGIVVGTSHCDMLMRSNNREWKPWLAKKGYENVSYDYSIPGRNREILQEYWRESVEQNKDFEVCYTLGMRGIHDSGFETKELENMSAEERKQAEIDLLSMIIKDQRKILNDTLGRETMMTFVPYKEVLPLYDGGLEIPEDMTLVWANDNYGYIRRYPSEKEKNRKGGNGIYYHNSYWAPPSMSYVFLCSIPLAHTRNELQKAYNEGIRQLWVLNVGAMKPLEQEIEFFIRLGWEIGKEGALTEDVDAYVEDWINRNFTGGIGREVSQLLNDFSQLTNVRKLENMDMDAFSQIAYGDEAAVRIHRYEELFFKGNALYEKLPEAERDAFFQMVLMRIHAAYFTNLSYYYGDRSTLCCKQGKMQAAAEYGKLCRTYEDARRKLVIYYNKIMSEGKWDGMVNPEGFPPPRAAMMPVYTPPLAIGERKMLVTVWNEETKLLFTKPAVKWFEIGNGGEGAFDFEVTYPDFLTLPELEAQCQETASKERRNLSGEAHSAEGECGCGKAENGNRRAVTGTVRTEQRILVSVKDASADRQGVIVVRNVTDGETKEIPVEIKACVSNEKPVSFADDGMICIEADRAESPAFHVIKRLGRGQGTLMEAIGNGDETPLTYPVSFGEAGEVLLEIHRFPSLNSVGRIRIGVAVDDGPMQIAETESTDEWRGSWKKNVLNNVDRMYVTLRIEKAGVHQLHFYAMDSYFAFSRFILYTKERRENNFAGIAGTQSLPVEWDAKQWLKDFYGDIVLSPRPVEYAERTNNPDSLLVLDTVKCDEEYAKTVEPSYYLTEGNSIFEEESGAVKIDAASVLAQSAFAYTESDVWEYCGSESYGRSGLAMYIRKPELAWENPCEAPSLNYRIKVSGGTYTVWVLAKFSEKAEAYLGAGIDKIPFSEDNLYGKGCLWRYEAEQIYRYVPIGSAQLTEGEHLLSVYSMRSGLRFDRIYVTKGDELPPTDMEWGKNE